MFARLWRWPTIEEIEATEGLSDATVAWWESSIRRDPKLRGRIPVYPLTVAIAEAQGIEIVADPDPDGVVWFINTPTGIEEWTDRPLPARTMREGAYRYEGRVTLFNDDGSCPDFTGRSGPFVTQPINVPYAAGGVRLDRKRLIGEITRRVRACADDARRVIDTQARAREKQNGYEAAYAREAEGFIADVPIRCGACRHDPEAHE